MNFIGNNKFFCNFQQPFAPNYPDNPNPLRLYFIAPFLFNKEMNIDKQAIFEQKYRQSIFILEFLSNCSQEEFLFL